MTTVKTFYASRALARASCKPVKDAFPIAANRPANVNGLRWYTEEQAEITDTKLTTQEVFNKVANHLLTQNKRASERSMCMCKYRTANGLMCAAGVLITDANYKGALEGVSVQSSIPVKNALQKSGVDAKDISLVINLQIVHNNYAPEYWSKRLIDVAKQFHLNYDVVANHGT